MIAHRLKQARLLAGLTLKAAGETIGVTPTTIQNYEKGKKTPSSTNLLMLAKAFGVRTEYFFRTNQVHLEKLDFRKNSTFGKKAQEALILKITEQVEKRVELLGSFPTPPLPELDFGSKLPPKINAMDDLEDVAETLRSTWRLGLNPIPDLTDTLEARGFLVIAADEPSPAFSGLTAVAETDDGRTYPVIAVASQWPGDRQRFTLAHELGHLILRGRLASNLDEEKACNRFAGAFLVPRPSAIQALGESRKGLEPKELYVLKHEYGLSMTGWIFRAHQAGVIRDQTRDRLWRAFSSKGWRRKEPGTSLPNETPRVFEALVYRALAENYISDTKAAELLGMPLMVFQKTRRMEPARATADQ